MRHHAANTLVMKFEVKALIEALKKNRKGHDALFQKALAGWKKAVAKASQAVLDAKDSPDEILKRLRDLNSHGRCPMDQTKEYDTAISMLDMTTDEQIELTQHQYQCYVEDDWDWKDEWMGSNSAYTET